MVFRGLEDWVTMSELFCGLLGGLLISGLFCAALCTSGFRGFVAWKTKELHTLPYYYYHYHYLSIYLFIYLSSSSSTSLASVIELVVTDALQLGRLYFNHGCFVFLVEIKKKRKKKRKVSVE